MKLNMDQRVKARLDQWETRMAKTGRGVRQRRCLSSILFNFYNEYFTKKGLEGFGDFIVGGQVIRTVKCADDFVLLAKEETGLEGVIDRIIETGIFCGMEINTEETKVMRT
jgi:hypothetical protein